MSVLAVVTGGTLTVLVAIVLVAMLVGLGSDELLMFIELGGAAISAVVGFILGAIGLVFVPKEPSDPPRGRG